MCKVKKQISMQQKGNLTMSQIILASASPRRRELLEQIGLNFEVCPAKGEEIIIKKEPKEVVILKEILRYDRCTGTHPRTDVLKPV